MININNGITEPTHGYQNCKISHMERRQTHSRQIKQFLISVVRTWYWSVFTSLEIDITTCNKHKSIIFKFWNYLKIPKATFSLNPYSQHRSTYCWWLGDENLSINCASDLGDFQSLSIEILVFASPTNYMLTSYGFPLLNWGIFVIFM